MNSIRQIPWEREEGSQIDAGPEGVRLGEDHPALGAEEATEVLLSLEQ